MKNSLLIGLTALTACNPSVDYTKETSLSSAAKVQITTLSEQFRTDCKTWLDPEKAGAMPPNVLTDTKDQVVAVLTSSGCEPDVMMACNTLHFPKVDQQIRVVDQGGDAPNCE